MHANYNVSVSKECESQTSRSIKALHMKITYKTIDSDLATQPSQLDLPS